MMHRKILSNWLITANSFNGAVFFKFTALRYHNFLGGLFEASTSLAKILYTCSMILVKPLVQALKSIHACSTYFARPQKTTLTVLCDLGLLIAGGCKFSWPLPNYHKRTHHHLVASGTNWRVKIYSCNLFRIWTSHSEHNGYNGKQ